MNAPEFVVFPGHTTIEWSLAVSAFAIGGPGGSLMGGFLANRKGLALTHSLTHPLTHPPTHSPTYSLTHLLTHLLTYALTHSLFRSQGSDDDQCVCLPIWRVTALCRS